MIRAALAAAVVVALAGCGFGPGAGDGEATVWVTRDRGNQVVLVGKVDAGQTALRALQQVASVKTRYGGRFVQSINGVAGDVSKQRDWLYFINGYEADRGAADYELRDGDIEWWDYRSWKGAAIHVPVVVGAFPEPFVHGYAGKTRKAAVLYQGRELRSLAKKLGKLVGADRVSRSDLREANVLLLTPADVGIRATGSEAGGPVRFVVGVPAARKLLEDRDAVRFRYQGLR